MTTRRIALFAAGLVVGYVGSGFVLGPGVAAVLAGAACGLVVAALFGR